MQTFLPYEDFTESARCLDRQRLGKQRVETMQILNALAGFSKGWTNHPAVRMWRGHESFLALYGISVCQAWTDRGYKDTCRQKIIDIYEANFGDSDSYPEWLGGSIHLTHQSKLIQKNPEYYIPIFGDIDDTLEYFWPV